MGSCFPPSLWNRITENLFDCLCAGAINVYKLEENLEDLKDAAAQLNDLIKDVKRKLEKEEDGGLQPLETVQGWIRRAEEMLSDVDRIINVSGPEELRRLCCCGYCSMNYIASYNFGKKVARRLNDIKNLKSQGVFDVLAEEAPAPAVDVKNIESVIGLELILENAWSCLMRDDVGILGLYGMEGVGKTTLLTLINNKFRYTSNDFRYVIWVNVSKDMQIERIKDDIAKRILFDEQWRHKSSEEKVYMIHKVLMRKKFALLLDDVWERVDLIRIGIPFPNKDNGCKIVFTTRNEDVCCEMEAHDQMEVSCLEWEEAWDLFRKKVGEKALRVHPDIPKLAQAVAEKCRGLPFALITIGRVMATKATIQEWDLAIDVLSKSESEFPGEMARKVYEVLKQEAFAIAQTDLEEIQAQHVARVQDMQSQLEKANALALEKEKQVEELTEQLQQEKRLRTDSEDAEASLQHLLHHGQSRLEKAYAMILEEQKAARNAIEEANALLLPENEKTKEAELAYASAFAKNEGLIKKLEEVGDNVGQVLDFRERLAEKLSYLESEVQELRQQILLISPTAGALTARPETTTSQEHEVLLLKCISQDIGFADGKPVAACLIYKCFLHWKLFEVERTGIFDRTIQIMESAVKDQNDSSVLSYWLSNAATLLMLLHQVLRAPQSAEFDDRVIGGLNDLPEVEVKYPALLFKQELTAYLNKIYIMIRANLRKEIAPSLGFSIKAARNSRAVRGSSKDTAAVCLALIAHWKSIVECLNKCLRTMRANCVSAFLISKVFGQIFSCINIRLFNSVILQSECCTFSFGENVKLGLDRLEKWCHDVTKEFAGSAWDELKHIRQAVDFLVMRQKNMKTFKELTVDLCPALSIRQLCKIGIMYRDDKYGTPTVSSEKSEFAVMLEASGIQDGKFSLDDDPKVPFSLDDISNSMQQIEVPDIDPPPLLSQNSSFTFLLERREPGVDGVSRDN